MPLVSREKIAVGKYDDPNKWVFTCDINVNVDGEFTTTIPQEAADKFLAAGIDLNVNRARRGGRPGFFSASTKQELLDNIGKIVADYTSRELVSKRIVIRYAIQTSCSYSKDPEGNIVPNCGYWWVKTENYKWLGGTVETDASHQLPFGIQIYARVFWREEYRYKSGHVKIEYARIDDMHTLERKDQKNRPNLFWLAGITSIRPPDSFSDEEDSDDRHIKEIDYDEQVAGFFVEILKYICRVNEAIKDKLEPETIKKMAHSNLKLLGSGDKK